MEYFSRLAPHKLINTHIDPGITTTSVFDQMTNKEWLSYSYSANSVVNIALRAESQLTERYLLMAGFKTDFSSRTGKNFVDNGNIIEQIKSIEANYYHFTSGSLISLKNGNTIFTGIQYTLGIKHNKKQLINLTDAREYNPVDNTALQGIRQDKMTFSYHALSFFFGASFTLGKGRPDQKN